jgi:hypothetical protein
MRQDKLLKLPGPQLRGNRFSAPGLPVIPTLQKAGRYPFDGTGRKPRIAAAYPQTSLPEKPAITCANGGAG